jgi:hypothetical protein
MEPSIVGIHSLGLAMVVFAKEVLCTTMPIAVLLIVALVLLENERVVLPLQQRVGVLALQARCLPMLACLSGPYLNSATTTTTPTPAAVKLINVTECRDIADEDGQLPSGHMYLQQASFFEGFIAKPRKNGHPSGQPVLTTLQIAHTLPTLRRRTQSLGVKLSRTSPQIFCSMKATAKGWSVAARTEACLIALEDLYQSLKNRA